MDLFLLSPMSIYTPLLGLMTKSILDDYPRLFFTFGFGMLLFGATFNFASWPLAFLFTVLFLAAGFGLGMLSASSFYLLDIKKGTEPIQFVIQQLLATLLAGTYYPLTVLPRSLQWIACLIPHTYAYDALRRLLDPGAQPSVAVLPPSRDPRLARVWAMRGVSSSADNVPRQYEIGPYLPGRACRAARYSVTPQAHRCVVRWTPNSSIAYGLLTFLLRQHDR